MYTYELSLNFNPEECSKEQLLIYHEFLNKYDAAELKSGGEKNSVLSFISETQLTIEDLANDLGDIEGKLEKTSNG